MTAGAFYSDMELTEQGGLSPTPGTSWSTHGARVQAMASVLPRTTTTPTTGQGGYRPGAGPYPADTVYSATTSCGQTSRWDVFGEISYDLSDSLTITGGLRYFDYEVDLAGSANGSVLQHEWYRLQPVSAPTSMTCTTATSQLRWTYSGGFFPYEDAARCTRRTTCPRSQ